MSLTLALSKLGLNLYTFAMRTFDSSCMNVYDSEGQKKTVEKTRSKMLKQ